MSEKFDVNKPEDLTKLLKSRKDQGAKRLINEEKMSSEQQIHMNHPEIANLMIKVINFLKVDPMIQKVISMRLMNPLTHGVEKTHLSIALELGVREGEVREIEQAGMDILEHHLQKTSSKDFIEAFNRETNLENTIQNELNKG